MEKKCLMKKIIVIMFGIFLSHPSWAIEPDEYKPLVATGLAEIDAFERSGWRVKRISKNGKTTIHEVFDPERTPHWRLISIDGQEPDQKQREEYDKGQTEEHEQKEQEFKVDNLSDMVPLHSLAIVDIQGQRVRLSFNPRLSGFDKEEQEKLTGILLLDIAKGALLSLEIYNTADLNPNFFVSFHQFSISMEFVQLRQQLMRHKLVSNIQGKAIFSNTFNQKLEQVYTDYVFLGE